MRLLRYVSVTIFLFTAMNSFAEETMCEDRNKNGSLIGTWAARYETVPSAFGSLVRVSRLEYKPANGTWQEYRVSGNERWKVVLDMPAADPVNGSNTIEISYLDSNASVYNGAWATYTFPYITTPNGRCSLFLVGYGYELENNPNAKGLVLIGDSNAWGQVSTFPKKIALIDELKDVGDGWRFKAAAISGMPWAQFENATIKGGNQHDELRGLLTPNMGNDTNAVVYNLGMNDGIWGLFTTDPLNTIFSMYDQIQDASRDPSTCVILITPHDPGPSYVREDVAVVAIWIRYIAGIYDNAHLVDWAADVRGGPVNLNSPISGFSPSTTAW